MSQNTVRIIAGLVVFAMLASVIALIIAAAATDTTPTPTPQQVETEQERQLREQLEQILEEQGDNGDIDIQLEGDQLEGDASADAVEPAALPAVGPSGLPSIATAELPPEAVTTLGLIDSGGPYPYDKDGTTFQNREGLLPDEPIGYYQEFTVDTPGLDHRGARRIVAGEGGELYYTSDHYESFSELLDWTGASASP